LNNYIFIPIGSYEQHGPHLPPDTDYLIAKKLVDIVSHIFNGSVIEGIKIGISPEHEGFKNTKSLSQKEFITQIETIIANYQSNSKIIIINAHGGNVVALNSTNKLKKKYILLLHTFSLIKNELTQIRTSDIGGICHAGEFETSIMLYIYPDKVNMNNLKKRDVKYVPTLDPNYDKEKLKNWKTIDLNQSGILGDPFHSSARKGELWFNFLIKKISARVKDFLNTY